MVLNKLCWALIFILLLPFILVLGPPVAFTIAWIALFAKINPCLGCCACLLFPIPFAFGLVFLICWIPMVLLGGPILLIKAWVESCRKKRQSRAEAFARINEIVENNRRLVN
jgi:hypothetical protein